MISVMNPTSFCVAGNKEINEKEKAMKKNI